MFKSSRFNVSRNKTAEINMSPLIDMVFILLIFFLVTASFVKDTGVTVDKPQASSSQSLDAKSLRIALSGKGRIFVEGERLDLRSLKKKVRGFVQKNKDGAIIVIPDKVVSSGRLVEVIDTAKLGGAKNISIATEKSR